MYFGGLLFPFGSFGLAGRSGTIEEREGTPKPKFGITRFLRTVAMVGSKACEKGTKKGETGGPVVG